jgi:hypothetical protein
MQLPSKCYLSAAAHFCQQLFETFLEAIMHYLRATQSKKTLEPPLHP